MRSNYSSIRISSCTDKSVSRKIGVTKNDATSCTCRLKDERSDIAVVLLAVRWASPPHDEVTRYCKDKLRLLEEINADTYAEKARELRDEESELRLEIERCSRDRNEAFDIAVKAFELSQSLLASWVTADYAAKRRILEIDCLNCTLDDVYLCVTMTKPFDLLAKRLVSMRLAYKTDGASLAT